VPPAEAPAPFEAPPPIELERRADRAWPAEEQVPHGPWVIRATHGVTNRANSVFTAPSPAVAPPSIDAAVALVEGAEAFYARRGLPAVFHLSPATWPPTLDTVLTRRGYLIHQPSEVWAADPRVVLGRTAPEAPTEGSPRGGSVEVLVAARADRAWMDFTYEAAGERRAIHEAIVGRIRNPGAFVSIRVRGEPIASGLGVSDTGWTGVFSMLTGPEHRRRGLASTVLHRLAGWAHARGDRGMYLQVLAANAAARRLYARLGFELAHTYHYRHRPAGNFR
jgi:GNAT superfamily N-acetyltransferase